MAKQLYYMSLNKEQTDFLELSQQGFSVKMIADTLKVSQRTIEERSAIVKRKTKARNLPHAVSISIDHGTIKNFITKAMIALLLIPLSNRELEILGLLQQGLTFVDITIQLTISIDTVKSHKKNIFKKLNAKSISHAVAIAKHMGYI